jgi:uncharacterized protein (DUF58 family)
LFGVAAVNTGNNLLYLLVSAFLGFMGASGLLGHWNLQGMQVAVRPGQELYAGLPANIEFIVTNRHRFTAKFLIRVILHQKSVLLPILPCTENHRFSLSFIPLSRGFQPLPEIRVESCFPVNFFVRSQALMHTQKILVFPRPLPGPMVGDGATGKQSEEMSSEHLGVEGEFYGIDDYRSGDPLKSIHWKLSARHDGLKTKRMVMQTAPSMLLYLDDFTGNLEQRLGQCAYLINRCNRERQAVGLSFPEHVIHPALGTAHRLRLLRELAIYDQRE